MRVLRILLVMGAALGHGPAVGAPSNKAKAEPVSSLTEVKRSLNRLLVDLLKMKQANAKNPDPASRRRMAASIDRALARVRATLAGEKRGVMNKRAFTALLRALDKQRDAAKRVALLRVKLGRELVRAEQAVKLVKLFRGEEGRISAAALLWPRLVDVKQRVKLQQAVGGKAAQVKLQQKVKFKFK